MKHTPGPWHRINNLHPEIIGFSKGHVYAPVCQLCPTGPLTEDMNAVREANANLIFAVPDLLKAAKTVLNSHDISCEGPECSITGIDALRAAIDKAEGKNSQRGSIAPQLCLLLFAVWLAYYVGFSFATRGLTMISIAFEILGL